MTLVWVIGRGGLLGSHVAGLGSGFRRWAAPPEPILWKDPEAARTQLQRMASAFIGEASASSSSWAVLWCAGAGVVGTSQNALSDEVETFSSLLGSLGSALEGSRNESPGFFFLASSAGGIHGGSGHRPITELSPPRPISSYGRAKLEIEEALLAWAVPRDVSTLIARISNLYGPGQKLDKPQGLISYMSRALIHHQAIHVYVPLDTIRDYLYVGDAGRWIGAWTTRLVAERKAAGQALHIRKLCAAEEETTIAGLVGVFRRIAKRQLKLVHGIHPGVAEQPLVLQFRSCVWPGEPDGIPRTALHDGIARVFRHQLALYEAGELPPHPTIGLVHGRISGA